MPTDRFDRRTTPLPAHQLASPDPAYAARPHLIELRDLLHQAARQTCRLWWNEPPTFFFDPKRQAELEAARKPPSTPLTELTSRIAAEWTTLCESVSVRHVARAIGLREAARALAPHSPAARELADLLAVPDDEVILALAPAERTGIRLYVRGAAEVAQLIRWLGNAIADEPVQLFVPAALTPDGTLPVGFAGCKHWLFPTQPLAAVPRIGGERVVLIGPAVVSFAVDLEPRFHGMAADCEILETLNPFRMVQELGRLYGRPRKATAQVPAAASAAISRAA